MKSRVILVLAAVAVVSAWPATSVWAMEAASQSGSEVAGDPVTPSDNPGSGWAGRGGMGPGRGMMGGQGMGMGRMGGRGVGLGMGPMVIQDSGTQEAPSQGVNPQPWDCPLYGQGMARRGGRMQNQPGMGGQGMMLRQGRTSGGAGMRGCPWCGQCIYGRGIDQPGRRGVGMGGQGMMMGRGAGMGGRGMGMRQGQGMAGGQRWMRGQGGMMGRGAAGLGRGPWMR